MLGIASVNTKIAIVWTTRLGAAGIGSEGDREEDTCRAMMQYAGIATRPPLIRFW